MTLKDIMTFFVNECPRKSYLISSNSALAIIIFYVSWDYPTLRQLYAIKQMTEKRLYNVISIIKMYIWLLLSLFYRIKSIDHQRPRTYQLPGSSIFNQFDEIWKIKFGYVGREILELWRGEFRYSISIPISSKI